MPWACPQVKFFPVSEAELVQCRELFAAGRCAARRSVQAPGLLHLVPERRALAALGCHMSCVP